MTLNFIFVFSCFLCDLTRLLTSVSSTRNTASVGRILVGKRSWLHVSSQRRLCVLALLKARDPTVVSRKREPSALSAGWCRRETNPRGKCESARFCTPDGHFFCAETCVVSRTTCIPRQRRSSRAPRVQGTTCKYINASSMR